MDLATISRWKIGGIADDLREVGTVTDVVDAMRSSSHHLVIGHTTNLLFDSEGYGGVLIQIADGMGGWTFDGTRVRVDGGASVRALVRAAAERGLGGIEHAAGIPGTIGGLVVMNGGSKRRGIGEHVAHVTVVDERGDVTRLDQDELRFSYRRSALQSHSFAVVSVELELEQVDREAAGTAVDAVLAEREGKFPLDLPNCGSTFLSDPALYATLGPPGQAIEQAGFKGLVRGGAEVSEKHANFIVNRGGATSDDVLWLIGTIRRAIWERTGIAMRAEVRHVARDGVVRPAHEAAELRFPELYAGE